MVNWTPLLFYNDLMNGGIINGDLLISGNLRVIGVNPLDDDVYKLVSDISEMDNIPFPWQHVLYDGSDKVDYEYVITENVGIGMTSPEYDLDVNGVSSMNIAIIPSLNVTGFIQPKHQRLSIASNGNIDTSFRLADNKFEQRLNLNGLKFAESIAGINQMDSDYLVNFSPYALSNDSRMSITGGNESELSFNDQARVYLDKYGDLLIHSQKGVNNTYFMAGNHWVSLSKEHTLGVNTQAIAKNDLDVAGNVVVGSSLAGKISAPQNSLMVQSRMGIGTPLPKTVMDIRGSMVVGNTTGYLGSIGGLSSDLVIEQQLFVQEYDAENTDDVLIVNGAYEGDGGMFFNKSATLENSNYHFDDASSLMIGYGSSILNRNLVFLDDQFIHLMPKHNGIPMELTNSGRIGIGPASPQSFFILVNLILSL